MKSPSFALMITTLCLSNASAITIDDLRRASDDYIKSIQNLKAESEVVRVSRLTSGKLCEKTFTVECLMRDYTMRHAYFATASVDGRKKWFDINESIIFRSGEMAEWRHPAFPGSFAYGESSMNASLSKTKTLQIGDPLYVLKRIRRSLDRPGAQVAQETVHDVIVHTPLPKGDRLEVRFSANLEWLPEKMTRMSVDENDAGSFLERGFYSIDYARQPSGEVVPQKATCFTDLEDEAAGTLTTTWTYSTFDTSAKPTVDAMALKIPLHVLTVDFETDEERRVTSSTNGVAADLKNRFGKFVQIQDRITAMKSVSTSFVGRCPDLPDTYAILSQLPQESIGDSSPEWRVGLFILHAVGALGITLYCRRRNTGTPE